MLIDNKYKNKVKYSNLSVAFEEKRYAETSKVIMQNTL